MGEAFSAGLGIALGLIMSEHILQITGLQEMAVAKQVLVCRKCAAHNPVRNKFCGDCGQGFYPPPQITCRKCSSVMPITMKFCGNCGLALPK